MTGIVADGGPVIDILIGDSDNPPMLRLEDRLPTVKKKWQLIIEFRNPMFGLVKFRYSEKVCIVGRGRGSYALSVMVENIRNISVKSIINCMGKRI